MDRSGFGDNCVAKQEKRKPVRVALFGAAPDTRNLGVSALFLSAVTNLARRLDGIEFVVFDNGFGERKSSVDIGAGKNVPIIRFGARQGRRYYRAENITTIAVASHMGRLGALINRAIALVDSCDAVLDVSGGDSFSDIYGRARFRAVYRHKAVAKARKKTLILLPQTYGPYSDPSVQTSASAITRAADMAWARDEESFAILRGLLGETYDADRHKSGVDMAFGLEAVPPEGKLHGKLSDWLARKDPNTPLVGLNISGLLYHKPDGGARDFQLKGDYRETVLDFLRSLLESTNAHVVLIPHVMDEFGHYESDGEACDKVARQLVQFSDRIVTSPATLDASEVKWVISRMDWFCGTRMHSTIASLSSGVATAAISYSDKTRGVFRTCAQQESVFDPRVLGQQEIVQRLLASVEKRDAQAQSLAAALPSVRSTLEWEFDVIAERILRAWVA